jgi:hypothetical protein
MSERYVFPRGPDRFEITGDGPQRYKWTCGMTIRQFYKAAAVIALYAGDEHSKGVYHDAGKDAAWAAELADAMIAEDVASDAASDQEHERNRKREESKP